MLEYCSEEACIPVLVLGPQLENFCLGDFLFSYDLKRNKKQEWNWRWVLSHIPLVILQMFWESIMKKCQYWSPLSVVLSPLEVNLKVCVCLLRSILTGFCWGYKPNIEDMWRLWQRRIWLYSFNTLSDNKAFSLHAVTLTLRGLILALNGCEQSDLLKFRQWENCDKQSRLAKVPGGGYIESMSVNAFC